jgi:hypothetical protein
VPADFFLPVRVLSRQFRRLFLERLLAAHHRLKFFGCHAALTDARAFAAWLAPLRRTEWVVYAKGPFGGPQAVLAYLSRYTHRVAIANSRLIAYDRNGVTFRWKDYRAEGRDRQKVMTLATAEFIRRFLIHVLPHGFHRIRHYGLLASGTRADNIARARQLLDVPAAQPEPGDDSCAEANEPTPLSHPCPCCGGRMIIIERFRLLAALPSGDFNRRHQDRHFMIKIGARQHYNTARLLRRLSTSKDHARLRATLDSRRIVQSPLLNPDSACPDWSTRLVASSVAFQTSIRRTSPTDRQRRNPHSV